MSSEDAIKVNGVVVEVLPNNTLRVELPNRHCVLGYVPKRWREAARFAVGDRVTLRLSVFDFSRGRIEIEEPLHQA